MRFDEGYEWLETIVSYISLAEFPRLHECIRTEHMEAIVGADTLKEIDYLTLGVLRHDGRTAEEIAACNNLREHYYLGICNKKYGEYVA